MLFLCFSVTTLAQNKSNSTVFKGRIIEKGTNKPLDGAYIILPQYSLWAITDENGNFNISNTPIGETTINITLLGYVPIEQKFKIGKENSKNEFALELNSLRLKDVEVTARSKTEGATPVTSISRSAIDHIQATSLADVLSLLPGSVPANQSFNTTSTAGLRNYSDTQLQGDQSVKDSYKMSSMGTSIIVDNAPLSNNSNLQVLSTTANNAGGFSSVAGTGMDLRQISTDNIESVDVIQGIASVQYGDATAGAVIVRSKAGKSPIQLRFKLNPNITQTSLSAGHSLGGKNGNINYSLDYAHSLNKESEAGKTYNRYSAKILYSNTFFDKLRTNFSFDFISGQDKMKQDQDDIDLGIKKHSNSESYRFNANGSYLVNGNWLKTIQYTFSTTYTKQSSFYQEITKAAENIYSTAMQDNTIVSSLPNTPIYDINGNQLTNSIGLDENAYAYSTQNSYLASYNVDGKEWNTFASLKASFAKELGISSHRLLIGGDFKSEGNKGEGKTFDIKNPPTTGISNGGIRERSYKDIPFLQTYGAYAEENLRLDLGGREFELQLGVRLDKQNEIKAEISPRLNASFEVLKKKLYVRGGYGEMVKSAPLLYVFPENAYFDLLNYTDKATNINNPQYLMTTRAFDTRNYDLRLAKNKKAEFGFNWMFGHNSFSATVFKESMKNGYGSEKNYIPVMYDKYNNGEGGLIYDDANSRNVYLTYYKPSNSLRLDSKGFDFDLNIGRIDAVRTSFILNGGFIETETSKSQQTQYIRYDDFNSKYIGLYDAGSDKYKRQRFSTNLRIIHNIPELGFVASLSVVTTWVNKYTKAYTNDSIPTSFISIADNKVYAFNPDDANNAEYKNITKTDLLKANRFNTEKLPVLWSFNLNLTKEIGKNLSVSFFANNLFSYRPRYRKLQSSTDSVVILNPDTFFGIELYARIPW